MGSQIKTVLRLICCLVFFIFFATTTSYAQNLQLPKSEIRVAINNLGFHGYTYNKISLYAQKQYFVYDKSTWQQIATIEPTDVLNIALNNGNYDLTLNDDTPLLTQVQGDLVITCQGGLIGVQGLKRAGKDAIYRGKFEIDRVPNNNNLFYLINVVDLQSYLRGVVPNEMPVTFGLEALKAQTIAAKNYVLAPRTYNRAFDVDDSVASQVYYGANLEAPLANQAISQTEGLVALYNWDLITAVFSSTAGGYTESYENSFSDPRTGAFPSSPKGYLKARPDIYSVQPLNTEEAARKFYLSKPDSYDVKSPYYRWQKVWGDDTEGGNGIQELQTVLSKTLPSMSKSGFVSPKVEVGEDIGNLIAIKVPVRGDSGKAMTVDIVTDKNTYHIQKELVIRRTFQKNNISLPSANVVFDNIYDKKHNLVKVVATGGGFGHGVGMSQFGAGFMGTYLHKPFDKILKRYYTGITISTIPVILSANSAQQSITQNFYAPYKRAVLVVDNKYKLSHITININGQEKDIILAKNPILSERITRTDISSFVNPRAKNTVTFCYPTEEGSEKGIRLYIELVGKDDSEYEY